MLVPAAALAATGSIEGTVTDAVTHDPIGEVEVCAWTADEGEFAGCAFTESDGSYLLDELEPGEYKIEFWPEGLPYEFQFYEGTQTWSLAKPVTVASGATTSGIDAELDPVAAIAGVVTRSSDGQPVEEVEVCAWPVVEPEESFGACAYTAGDGSYLIPGLEAGEYDVEFWPAYTGQNLAYQFYEGKDRPSEADAVVVEAGDTTSGIDAELDPGAMIRGTVSTGSGVPLEEMLVCSIDAPTGQLWICNLTEGDGSYDLPLLSKGQYKVVFSPDLSEWFEEEEEGEFAGDGYPTQFWNNQTTLAAANVIPLATGQLVTGIDARFGPALVPPAITPIAPKPRVHRKRKHCPKGKVRKKIKGKVRCVKRHKHRRHRHHRGSRPTASAVPGQRPLFRVAP
jgi:hypothetical protein